MAGDGLGLGLMAASHLMGGIADNGAAQAAARVDNANARLTELDTAFATEGIRRDERATSGEAIAALAGNGVALGTGSALDLLRQNAMNREFAVMSRQYQGATEAASLRASAQQKKAAGRSALFGGVLRAGASIIIGERELKADAALRAAQLPRASGLQMPVPAHLAFPLPASPFDLPPLTPGPFVQRVILARDY